MLRMMGHWQIVCGERYPYVGNQGGGMVPVRYWKTVRFVRVERLGIFQKALLMLFLHEVASSGNKCSGLSSGQHSPACAVHAYGISEHF
eukprot:965447-Pelagomonas_calceolata.AAC.1